MVEGIAWRFRTGAPWRDLPVEYGPWKTVWKRHRRFSGDGTWDKIHAELLAEADAGDHIGWAVSVDSTINRAHQHDEPPARHRGHYRTTRICVPSRLTTRSAVHAGVCPRRSTISWTDTGCRWSC